MAPAISTSVVDISPLNSPPVLTSMTASPSRVSIRSTPASRAPTAEQARSASSSMSGVSGQGSADQRRERQSSGARRTAASPSTAAKRQLAKIQFATFDDKMLGQDLQTLLLELKVSSTPFGDDFEDYLQDLIRETSLLELMAASLRSEESTQTLLTIACFDERGRQASKRLRELYHSLFEREFGCQPIKCKQPVKAETLLFDGPLAAQVGLVEAGTHLFVSSSEGNIPIVVSACQISGPDQLPEVDRLELQPIIRIYSELDSALDLRSRLLAKGKLGSAELRAFVLSAMPLPPEFEYTKGT